MGAKNKAGAGDTVLAADKSVPEDSDTPRNNPGSVPGTSLADRGDTDFAAGIVGRTFCGNPVDVERRTGGYGAAGTSMRRDYDSYTEQPGERGPSTRPCRGPLMFDHNIGRTPNGRTPSTSEVSALR